MLRRCCVRSAPLVSRLHYSTASQRWQDMDFSVPFKTKLELAAADEAANGRQRFDELVREWDDYPSVQASLRTINDRYADVMKDQDWAEMRKQFKTESSTVDWSFLKENFPFPQIIADAQKAMDSYTLPDVDVSDIYIPELVEGAAKLSQELRADFKELSVVLPELELEMARTKYLEENLDTINMHDERARMPEIFAEIDKELQEMNWDDEPHVMPKFGDGWPKDHHHH